MKFLLDTHVWLWALESPRRLGTRTQSILQDSASEIFLSAVTTWEISIKWRLGKLKLSRRPEEIVIDSLANNRLTPLSVTHEHAWRVGDLADHHNDPFDRLLVAQAQAENFCLITADDAIRPYPVHIQWALD